MAKRTTTSLVCDVSGVETADVRTVTFGHGSKTYVTDLAAEHADRLESVLREFAGYARAAGSNGGKPRPVADRERSAAIRVWAREQGLTVSDRGRIPAEVMAKYEDAH